MKMQWLGEGKWFSPDPIINRCRWMGTSTLICSLPDVTSHMPVALGLHVCNQDHIRSCDDSAYNIVLVLPNIEMNPPQVYMCSPSWTLLPPPSPYHPSGSSQCTSHKHPVSCIEPGLATRSIYDIIHFIAILPNHPTLSLSHRVQKTVLYISVSFAVLYTGLLLPSF